MWKVFSKEEEAFRANGSALPEHSSTVHSGEHAVRTLDERTLSQLTLPEPHGFPVEETGQRARASRSGDHLV